MVQVQSAPLCFRRRTVLFSDSCALDSEVWSLFNLLQDLAASIGESDVVKFTDVVKEFDSMSRLVRFLTTFLGCNQRLSRAVCGSYSGIIRRYLNLQLGPQIVRISVTHWKTSLQINKNPIYTKVNLLSILPFVNVGVGYLLSLLGA